MSRYNVNTFGLYTSAAYICTIFFEKKVAVALNSLEITVYNGLHPALGIVHFFLFIVPS